MAERARDASEIEGQLRQELARLNEERQTKERELKDTIQNLRRTVEETARKHRAESEHQLNSKEQALEEKLRDLADEKDQEIEERLDTLKADKDRQIEALKRQTQAEIGRAVAAKEQEMKEKVKAAEDAARRETSSNAGEELRELQKRFEAEKKDLLRQLQDEKAAARAAQAKLSEIRSTSEQLRDSEEVARAESRRRKALQDGIEEMIDILQDQSTSRLLQPSSSISLSESSQIGGKGEGMNISSSSFVILPVQHYSVASALALSRKRHPSSFSSRVGEDFESGLTHEDEKLDRLARLIDENLESLEKRQKKLVEETERRATSEKGKVEQAQAKAEQHRQQLQHMQEELLSLRLQLQQREESGKCSLSLSPSALFHNHFSLFSSLTPSIFLYRSSHHKHH
jgi:chromosome segregation ATPase